MPCGNRKNVTAACHITDVSSTEWALRLILILEVLVGYWKLTYRGFFAVDYVLDDCFQLISLLFLTVGRNNEAPAT